MCIRDSVSTVYEASVRKYLPLSQRLGGIPGITPYVRQRIDLLADSVATLFPGASAQTTLDAFRPRAAGPGDGSAPSRGTDK